MALVMKEDYAAIGIELELIKLETAALKGILNDAALDYDLCLYQFTDNLGTDFTLRNQLSLAFLLCCIVAIGCPSQIPTAPRNRQ